MSIAADAVLLALEAAKDLELLTPVTLHLGKTQSYNYATDANTASGGSDPTGQGVFWKERQKQNAENTTSDSRFLVAATDAPTGITEADTATILGKVWNIEMVEPVAGVAYILHLRK